MGIRAQGLESRENCCQEFQGVWLLERILVVRNLACFYRHRSLVVRVNGGTDRATSVRLKDPCSVGCLMLQLRVRLDVVHLFVEMLRVTNWTARDCLLHGSNTNFLRLKLQVYSP